VFLPPEPAGAGIGSAPDLSAFLSTRVPALGTWDDVRSYGVVANGVADDTAALQSALNNVPAGKSLLVPPGAKIRITSPVSVTRANMRLVGAPETLFGVPPGAPNGPSIYVDDPGVISGGFRVSSFRAIRVFGANFLMKDLYCYSNDNPWQGIANSVLSQETAVDLGAGSDGSAIVNCTFEYHFGHCIRHNSASAADLLIAYCTFRNCANGLNIANGLRSVQICNLLERCNGIESGNDYVTVAYNTLIDSSGIAMGGTTSPPANTGHFCHHNLIVRPLSSGIVVTNVEDTRIEDNVIMDVSAGHGIAVVGNFVATNEEEEQAFLHGQARGVEV